jgi:hypothetical protein
MTRPKVHEFNIETQEEVIREMNDAEYELHLSEIDTTAARQAEIAAAVAAKAAAKAQALAALGLSQEVVNLLAE